MALVLRVNTFIDLALILIGLLGWNLGLRCVHHILLRELHMSWWTELGHVLLLPEKRILIHRLLGDLLVLFRVDYCYHLRILWLARVHHPSILLMILNALWWSIHILRWVLLLGVLIHEWLLWYLYLDLLHLIVLV